MVTVIATDDIAVDSLGTKSKPDYTLRDVAMKASFKWDGESCDRLRRFFRPPYSVEGYKEVSQADLNGYVNNCQRDIDEWTATRFKSMKYEYAKDLQHQVNALRKFMTNVNPGSHIYMQL